MMRLPSSPSRFERAALGAVLVIAVAPALCGFVYAALASVELVGVTQHAGATFRAYRHLLASGDLVASATFTVWIAFAATVVSAIVALPLALALRHARGLRVMVRGLVALPLPIPHLVAAATAVQLFAASGLLARVLLAAHAASSFDGWVFDRAGLGIIVVYAWKEIPWLTLVLIAALEIAGDRHEAVAATLGAGRVRRLLFVVVPIAARAAWAPVLLLCAYVLGAFEVPLLVGKTWPPMLSVLAYQRFTGVDLARRPEAFALAVMTTMVVAAVALAARPRRARGDA